LLILLFVKELHPQIPYELFLSRGFLASEVGFNNTALTYVGAGMCAIVGTLSPVSASGTASRGQWSVFFWWSLVTSNMRRKHEKTGDKTDVIGELMYSITRL
jgi:hypothetical protein